MIDTHAHYDHKRFHKNRHTLLSSFAEAGIKAVINPAISFASNSEMREMLAGYPWIYYGAGIHPNRVCEAATNEDDSRAQQLRTFANDSRTVAIGETGLDYARVTQSELRAQQRSWFQRQIAIAEDRKLPLILHVRDAHADALSILRMYRPSCGGVIHCFDGDVALAKAYLDLGFLIGVGGQIAYLEKTEFRDAVKYVPITSILLETDAPFVRPRGFGRKQNTSLSLPIVAQEIAALKGQTMEVVTKTTTEQAVQLFRLKNRPDSAGKML